MSLTRKEVEEIAHLARLSLSENEVAQYQDQLSTVLDYIAQISELDLTDIAPTTHAISQKNVFREDKAEPAMLIDEVLINAPQQANHQFKIQAILDE